MFISVFPGLKVYENKTGGKILSNINSVYSQNSYTLDNWWLSTKVRIWAVSYYTSHLLTNQITRKPIPINCHIIMFQNAWKISEMIARKGSSYNESVSVTETDVTAVRSSEWSLRCTLSMNYFSDFSNGRRKVSRLCQVSLQHLWSTLMSWNH